MRIGRKDLELLTESEFLDLERRVEKMLSVWEIRNLRGQAAVFHDDQHIGEKRRELKALNHPCFDVEAEMRFRSSPVVDSLEGNSLIHPLTTPVIEVNDRCDRARAVWWSLGVESLSKFREVPTAIISLGMVPGTHVKENEQWKILSGMWQRTTKNEYHAGWVRSMIPTNTRPPLTAEEDRAFLGRFAYQKNEIRKAVPEPPRKDTWERFPDETDEKWMYLNLKSFIFDLDGVLVFTDQLHYMAWKQIAGELEIEFTEKDNDRLRGISRRESLEIILEKYRGKPLTEEEKRALAEKKNEYYRALLKQLSPGDVSEEVRSVLAGLRERGYRLAVGSSSKNAGLILELTGLRQYFDAVSDGNHITRSKPDPEVFIKACEYLGADPEHCVVVEDAEAGILAGKAAGMVTAGIGRAAECGKADIRLKSLDELLTIYS